MFNFNRPFLSSATVHTGRNNLHADASSQGGRNEQNRTNADLHKRDFHHYINQWGHFLIAFPQAFDLVLESLEDQQEDVKAAILERRNFITQELQWHASFIQ
ncbi:hypothetical protein C5167_047209, partial [Papaver somniferum]